jgi:hypothetical protein
MSAAVLDWLLDSDPAIRWQVMRDLLDAPEAEWTAERAKLETEGWGARLLAARDPDGQWAGAAFWPPDVDWHRREQDGQPWTATCWALTDLREFGLDPASESARRTVELVGENSPWEEGNQPFWDGEVEECINGRTAAVGAYFGVDVGEIVTRLVGERQSDGGWNCERANGSVRASFHSTINVLEAFSSTRRRPVARPRPARRGGPARPICWNGGCSGASRRALRPTRTSCASCIQTATATTSCGRSTTSAPRLRSTACPRTRASARPSRSCAGGGSRTDAGRSTGRRAGGCGSRSTTDRASRRAG